MLCKKGFELNTPDILTFIQSEHIKSTALTEIFYDTYLMTVKDQ